MSIKEQIEDGVRAQVNELKRLAVAVAVDEIMELAQNDKLPAKADGYTKIDRLIDETIEYCENLEKKFSKIIPPAGEK